MGFPTNQQVLSLISNKLDECIDLLSLLQHTPMINNQKELVIKALIKAKIEVNSFDLTPEETLNQVTGIKNNLTH